MDEEFIDDYVCAKGRCKQASTVSYLGTPLCDKHWQQLCDKQDRDYEKKKRALEALKDEALHGRQEEVGLSPAKGSK